MLAIYILRSRAKTVFIYSLFYKWRKSHKPNRTSELLDVDARRPSLILSCSASIRRLQGNKKTAPRAIGPLIHHVLMLKALIR